MDIQFIRLDPDLVQRINRLASEQNRTVSDLVNEIVRKSLGGEKATEQAASR